MNITINNTTKANWFSLYLNDIDEVEWEHHCPLDAIRGICLLTLNGNDGLELHMEHEDKPFFLSHIASDNFSQVDTVNGVAPTSLNDLRDKLLALF